MERVCQLPPVTGDPQPQARWCLYYHDSFDRDCLPSLEVEGCGLVPGLMELWVRHLGEGLVGFSSFNLSVESKGVVIVGARSAMDRLKLWILGERPETTGYRQAADLELLRQLALRHARLVVQGLGLESLLAEVENSTKADFFGPGPFKG